MKENLSFADDQNFSKYNMSKEITSAIEIKHGSVGNFLTEVESGKIDFFVGINHCISMIINNNTYNSVVIHEALFTTELIVENMIKFIATANINDYKKYPTYFDLEGNTYILTDEQKLLVSTFLKKCVHWLHEIDGQIYISYLWANLKIYINHNPLKYQYFFHVLEYIENHKTLELSVGQDGEDLANVYCIDKFNIDSIQWKIINKKDWIKSESIIIDDDTKNKAIPLFDPEIASKITETAKEISKTFPNKKTQEEIKQMDDKRKEDEQDFFKMAQRAIYDCDSTYRLHSELTLLSSGTATTANIDLKNMFSIYLHILSLAEALMKKPDMESFIFPSDIRAQFAVMKTELLSFNFRFIHDWLTSENFRMGKEFAKAFGAAAYVMFEVAEKEEFSKMLHDTVLELGSFDHQITTNVKINKYKIRTVKEIVEDTNKGILKAIGDSEMYTRFRYACDYFSNTNSSGYSVEVNLQEGIVFKVPHLTISLNLLLSDFIKFDEEIGLLEVNVLSYYASYEKSSLFKEKENAEILDQADKLLAFINTFICNNKYNKYNLMAGSSGVLVRDKEGLIDITKLDYTSSEGLIADVKNYEIMIHRNLGILFKVLINLVAIMMKQHNSAQ